MNYGIQYLCHLVQAKNDLNRKRRRMYYAINPGQVKVTIGEPQFWDPRNVVGVFVMRRRKKGSITKKDAKKVYKQTQKEMKAMTPEMKRVRKEINARFVWSAHGAIKAIRIGYDEYYDYALIARYAELWRADAILLGD